jgi:hypothetical protein
MFLNEIKMWKRIQNEVRKEEENERIQENVLKQFLTEKC